MSSGGMDWAYRMLAQHHLDPLGAVVVLHLGWRDAPNQRTDTGIARATGQHRSAIRKATAKLAALGVIARRSGQWVAVETIRVVEEAPNAPRPDRDSSDPEARPLRSRGHSVASPRPLSGHAIGHSVATMRKENKKKGDRAAKRPDVPSTGAARAPARPPLESGGREPVRPSISPFVRSQIERGETCIVAGRLVQRDSSEMSELQAQLRAERFAEKRQAA